MVVIVVMIVMWTCHVDVVHTRILQALFRRLRELLQALFRFLRSFGFARI